MTAKQGRPIRRLRIVARIEGVTLLTLIGLAVPAKHLLGWADGVHIMGPIHGIVFVTYLVLLAEAVAAGGWRGAEIARTVGLSLVPFGPFFNDGLIARKAAEAAA